MIGDWGGERYSSRDVLAGLGNNPTVQNNEYGEINKSEDIVQDQDDIVGGSLLGGPPAARGLPGQDAPRQLPGVNLLHPRPHQIGHCKKALAAACQAPLIDASRRRHIPLAK